MNFANELRIGNYVLVDDNHVLPYWHPIRAKDIADIENGNLFNKGIAITPIELSSDILIKSGFELIKRSFVRDKFKIFALSCINPSFCIKCGGQYLKIAEIKYVHQLQNIYFALVGTELNITL